MCPFVKLTVDKSFIEIVFLINFVVIKYIYKFSQEFALLGKYF